MHLKVHIHVHLHKHIRYEQKHVCIFIRVKLQSPSMVQNLDPKLALKKKLEHRARQNQKHHWFGRARPAQCGWQEVARPARAAGPKKQLLPTVLAILVYW